MALGLWKSAAAAATIVASLGAASSALAEMVTKTSPHSVPATVEKFSAAVDKAGAKVFATIEHAKGAASIGETLRPTTLVIFGNPKVGTPAMASAQTMGLDLPLRVLFYEDASGATQVVYHAPKSVAAAHGLDADHKAVKVMTGALDKLTSAAIAN